MPRRLRRRVKHGIRLGILIAAVCAALPLRAAIDSRFGNFVGTYSLHGTTRISDRNEGHAKGTSSLFFSITKNGTGRLGVVSTIEFKGGTRTFSSLYLFRLRSKTRGRVAEFTNLAPGIKDGVQGDGTYTINSRVIRADAPFEIGDAQGHGTLVARLRNQRGGVQLLIIQTLSASTLNTPIVWRFSAHR